MSMFTVWLSGQHKRPGAGNSDEDPKGYFLFVLVLEDAVNRHCAGSRHLRTNCLTESGLPDESADKWTFIAVLKCLIKDRDSAWVSNSSLTSPVSHQNFSNICKKKWFVSISWRKTRLSTDLCSHSLAGSSEVHSRLSKWPTMPLKSATVAVVVKP